MEFVERGADLYAPIRWFENADPTRAVRLPLVANAPRGGQTLLVEWVEEASAGPHPLFVESFTSGESVDGRAVDVELDPTPAWTVGPRAGFRVSWFDEDAAFILVRFTDVAAGNVARIGIGHGAHDIKSQQMAISASSAIANVTLGALVGGIALLVAVGVVGWRSSSKRVTAASQA